jgi:thiopeptide-type bacteriocin biosynthesis protein
LYQPGGEWLYLKVPSSADLHDTVLARHLPGLVRRAEPLTDRWFFLRYREQDKDQLRLRFHGDPATLWGTLLGVVHDWLEGLRHAGLVGPFSIDGYRPEIFRYGGPEAIRAAEEAFAADSRAALEQVALRTSGRLEQPLELVAAANHLDLLTHLDPHGWRDWLLDSYPKDGYHRAFQTHRRRAIALLDRTDDWAALREVPGGERLVDAWRRRAPRVAAYGELIRGLVAAGKLDSATGPFRSILHLSHNRHAGIGIDAERSTYAILRGVAQAQWDRERHAS